MSVKLRNADTYSQFYKKKKSFCDKNHKFKTNLATSPIHGKIRKMKKFGQKTGILPLEILYLHTP